MTLRSPQKNPVRVGEDMMIRDAIDTLVGGGSLSMDQAAQAMDEIMEGEATPAQFGAFVTALRLKGETVDEVAGMARTMREKSLHVEVDGPLVDTCGTGGDASGTFNELTRHSAWDRMSQAGAQLMTWFGLACELHRDWRNDIEGLGALFSNHIPDYRNLITSYNTLPEKQ